MRSIRHEFAGAEGATLSARLELTADGEPRAFALFAHCFTCSKDLHAVVRIARALAARGIAVLRFDFTGLGESEGDFAATGFSSNVADLLAAARFLEERYRAPELLVGHSLGGAAVLCAASELESVKAVATIAAPSDPAHVLRLLAGSRDEIERDGEAEVRLAGRSFRIKKEFLDDVAKGSSEEAIRSLGASLLIFHSPTDEVVGIENAERIYRAARHPKSFVSLDGADHLLTDPEDALYVGRVLAAWADRYLSGPREVAGEGEVVAITPAGGLRTAIRAGRHALVADEPASVGGSEEGPTPYDLLAAALGACTSMTLQLYARRKKWPLEAAHVRLRHRKEHARDCEECRPEDRIDVLDREVSLIGQLDREQRARLLEIANRCPVHRTLERGVEVETRLVG